MQTNVVYYCIVLYWHIHMQVDDLLLVIKSNQHKYEFLNTAFGR